MRGGGDTPLGVFNNSIEVCTKPRPNKTESLRTVMLLIQMLYLMFVLFLLLTIIHKKRLKLEN